ncbi:MAG: NADH-quinone oxidoreductase subunit C [Acidobacteria bacterium]|nr:NADH-quinone oxidoreductase subunit C [Acidobacteriota bacterium]
MLSEQILSIPAVRALEERQPGVVTDANLHRGQLSIWVAPEQIVPICRFLKQEQTYQRLSSITAVDWFPVEPRFEVVYSLHSFERNHWLRVKCRMGGESPEIDSVTGVWRAANWYEREVFDLFGIRFRNHPDLSRIMMPDDWQGHPLRKNYPLSGPR